MSRPLQQLWRNSATLMLIARSTVPRAPFDYTILLLQRSSKSRFMPSRYVFPGGLIEKADFSEEWLDLYRESSTGLDFSSLVNMKEPRPPIFKISSTAVPSEVALRICAIRETFEESGILLLKKMSKEDGIVAPKGSCATVYEHPCQEEIEQWREDVHNDPTKFIALCRHLKSVPDIWALGEWSNWLTPPSVKIRFDTAFFICFIDHEPVSQHDNKEMTHSQDQKSNKVCKIHIASLVIPLQWKMPLECVMEYFSKKTSFGPPQMYTFFQLCRICKWQELKAFQEARANEGSDRWMPITINSSDGRFITLLPGDDLYPMALDYIAKQTHDEYGVRGGIVPEQKVDETVEELESRTKNHNRLCRTNAKEKHLHKILVQGAMNKKILPPICDTDEIQKLARHLKAKL